MTPDEEHELQLGQLEEWINYLGGTPVNELIQNSDGTLRYDEIETQVKAFKEAMGLLKIDAIKMLPSSRINSIDYTPRTGYIHHTVYYQRGSFYTPFGTKIYTPCQP